jgi:serine/threonine protein kinase
VTMAAKDSGTSPESDDDGEARESASPNSSLVGKVLGERFRVLERLAAGGMGVVYLAEQMPLGRKVAVKVLTTPSGASETEARKFRERFLLEAASSAQLSHSNTVVVHDYGAVDDLCYIVMEYISGHTLMRELRTGGPLPLSRALPIALQITAALQHAHEARMVHRDLKPANVMLTRRGATEDFVKVLDFGLVKSVDDEDHNLTHHDVILGSPRYMAPEQVQAGKVDARTDIYSFGTVLFQMLSGSPPFNKGSRIQILVAHVRDAPPSLQQECPNVDVPPRLEALVMRCLAKNPDDRPQTMQEVGAELLACMSDVGLSTSALTADASGLMRTGVGRDGSSASMSRPIVPDQSGTVRAPAGVSGKPAASVSDAAAAIPIEASPSPAGRGKTLMLVLGIVGVAALGGAVMISSRASNSASSQTATPSGATPSGATPTVTQVSLVTDPPGARVQREGRDLGTTPVSLAIPQGEQWRVELSRPGYATQAVQVGGGQTEARVRLEAAVNAGPAVAATSTPQTSLEDASARAAAATQRAPSRPRTGSAAPNVGARPQGTAGRTSDNRDPWAQ